MEQADKKPMPARKQRRWLSSLAVGGLSGLLLIAACDRADTAPKDIIKVKSGFGAYLAARQAVRASDSDTAAQLYARALADDPDNLRIMGQGLLAFVRAGYRDAANKLAARLIKVQPNSSPALLVLAAKDARDGDFAQLRKRAARLNNAGANVLLKPLLSAWAAYGDKDIKEADIALSELDARKAFANFRDIHSGLIHDLAGNTSDAQARLLAAYQRQALAPFRVLTAMTLVQAREGKKQDALKAIDAYLKAYPTSVGAQYLRQQIVDGKAPKRMVSSARDGVGEVFFNVASALNQERSAARALFYARLATFARGEDATSQFLIGSLQERRGRHAAAIASYRAIKKASPIWWDAQKAIATNLAQSDRHEEAVALLQKLAKEQPKRWDVLVVLGALHRSKQAWLKAVDAYDRAFALIGPPQRAHASVLYLRGIALERSKQWARAEADFRQSLALRPDAPDVLNYLAYSWVERGENLVEAEKMLKKAVSLRPNSGYIVDSLGWAYYRTGRFAEAVPLLERAAQLQPEDPTVNDHLGDAFWRVGRKAEARVQWRRALSLKPEADVAAKIREKLSKGMAPFRSVTDRKKPAPAPKPAPPAPDTPKK